MRERTRLNLPNTIEPDPVIEAYKKDVDRTLLRENLELTPTQRIEKLARFIAELEALKEEPDKLRG